MNYLVKPIYGNGWTAGGPTLVEPDPFEVHSDDQGAAPGIIGTIITRGHEFEGYQFEALPRFSGTTMPDYNCTLLNVNADGDKRTIYGYCLIDTKAG